MYFKNPVFVLCSPHDYWFWYDFLCHIWYHHFEYPLTVYCYCIWFNYFCLLTSLLALWASLVVQRLKQLPAVWETWVQSLGWEDPLEEEMATHSSILVWRIPWTDSKELDMTDQLHFTSFVCGWFPTFIVFFNIELFHFLISSFIFLISSSSLTLFDLETLL